MDAQDLERPLLPQVFIMLFDPVLEKLYRSKLQSNEYCLVWGDSRWKESLYQFEYDALIVDLACFSHQPIENLLTIRKLTPSTELIVLSESDDVRRCIAAFRMGVAEYFLKPVNPESIAWAIEKVLHQKQLQTSDESLHKDLTIFSTAHHISLAGNDSMMRRIALKHLTQILEAQGAAWLWPKEADKSASSDPECYFSDANDSLPSIALFLKSHSHLIETSFASSWTSHSEKWFMPPHVWIPLKSTWMGGVALFGVSKIPNSSFRARLEFLIRNLEISLENQRKLVEAKQLTFIDDVTGLYNARFLDVAITAAIEQYYERHSRFAVLFIDIDHFKKVNDSHGHLVGSQLLIDTAQFFRRNIRKPDQLFRYGGDEFIAILQDCTLDRAMQVAQRLRQDVAAKPFFIQNKELRLTLSIGVANFPEHGKTKEHIIRMADEAMYAGKKSGRNAVFISGQAAHGT